MGERAFTRAQFGIEGVRGTAAQATHFLYAAPIPLTPDRVPQYHQDMSATRARSVRDTVFEYLVRNSLRFDAEHPLYYQLLPFLFSCGLKGSVVAAEQTGGQGDYLWTFTPSLVAANSPESMTLEIGDDVQAYETEFVMFERFRIAGEIAQDGVGGPVTMEADFFGRQWTATSFTSGLALPTTEIMNAKMTQFYLDTSWAGVGGTEKTGLLRAFDIEILTGIHPKFNGDAQRYFSGYGESYIEVMAALTFEGNSDADAIWDVFNTRALAVARIKTSGAAIGSGVAHSLTLDIGGTWENVIPLASEDRGDNLHTAILHGKYDATGAKLLQVLVSTDVAVLPSPSASPSSSVSPSLSPSASASPSA